MLSPISPAIRRPVVIGGAIALALIAVAAYALVVGQAVSERATLDPGKGSDAATEHTSESQSSDGTGFAVVPELTSMRDPLLFAQHVAEALFAWDTTTMTGRADHIEQLIKVADPTGESTSGLLADLNNYLPTPSAWTDLAQYETKQWLVIESAQTPTQWATAQAQAGDQLLPGTTAVTIHGIRHRTGVWEGAPVASEHDVAFTIFIVCEPSYPTCHLLRLSMPDKPLG